LLQRRPVLQLQRLDGLAQEKAQLQVMASIGRKVLAWIPDLVVFEGEAFRQQLGQLGGVLGLVFIEWRWGFWSGTCC